MLYCRMVSDISLTLHSSARVTRFCGLWVYWHIGETNVSATTLTATKHNLSLIYCLQLNVSYFQQADGKKAYARVYVPFNTMLVTPIVAYLFCGKCCFLEAIQVFHNCGISRKAVVNAERIWFSLFSYNIWKAINLFYLIMWATTSVALVV